MKKPYQKPSVKVRKFETEGLLAASPTIGGNTGIEQGEGDPPSSGTAKGFNLFGSGSDGMAEPLDWYE